MRLPTYSFQTLGRTAARACLVPLCAWAWHSAAAQTATTAITEPAANPAAKVPAVPYRSVFKDTSLGIERDKADWRKANDDVGKFTRGHVDILKQEEMENQPGSKPSASPSSTAPTAPVASPPPARAPAAPAPAHKH